MKTMLASLAVALALVGCASKRELCVTMPAHVPASAKISVFVPQDGTSFGEDYPKSGAVVARKLVAALAPYYPGASVGFAPAEYKISPQILHWEDRATEWSGKPDRVKISLPLYHGDTLVGNALVSAKSSWWTFGGDHPEGLIDLPFEVYAAGLAGIKKPNSLVIEK
jgi:hypothetical protein